MVANDELLNEGAFDVFHTYNVEQLIPVEVPGADYKVILSKYSEIDPTHYLDPHKNQVLTVDHTKGVVTSVEPNTKTQDSEVVQRRDALQTAVDAYIKDHYLSGLSSVYPSQENNNEFIICITASKFNEKNFWSGRWRSVYRATYLDGQVKISGSMKVNVHYYENGNVQLNTSREYGETISTGSNVADEIVKVLSKAEGNFQNQIDTSCNNLSETFKSLRRRLPYTKTLYDFGGNVLKMADVSK